MFNPFSIIAINESLRTLLFLVVFYVAKVFFHKPIF